MSLTFNSTIKQLPLGRVPRGQRHVLPWWWTNKIKHALQTSFAFEKTYVLKTKSTGTLSTCIRVTFHSMW